jgi:hypothetical protein
VLIIVISSKYYQLFINYLESVVNWNLQALRAEGKGGGDKRLHHRDTESTENHREKTISYASAKPRHN